MKITYLGTTMLLFDDGKDQILFDCHITRPGFLKCFLGKLSTNKEVANKVIQEFQINRLKGIFISHTHHDHVLDATYFLHQCGGDLYGSYSCMNIGRGDDIEENRLHCYDDSMYYTIGDYHITIIPSIHSIAHWYNNDLGQVITKPFNQPARKKQYKEGNSYDFYIEHQGHTYLIRPSYNYLEGQLDHYQSEVLFLGVGGMSNDTEERKEAFFHETINKVHPKMVIPVHWDHFFRPLYNKPQSNLGLFTNNQPALEEVEEYCTKHYIEFNQQMPLTTIEFE